MMRLLPSIMSFVLLPVLTLTLAACGNSVPAPSTSAIAQHTYAPSNGAFAPVPTAQLQAAAYTSTDCNLDGVNGKAAGSQPLSNTGSALFSGWAADTAASAVPTRVQLVLTGAKEDYVVDAATGASRPDVAKVMHNAAFANAGYAVQADLSKVPAGDYGVTLRYSVAGKALKCVTKVRLSVQ